LRQTNTGSSSSSSASSDKVYILTDMRIVAIDIGTDLQILDIDELADPKKGESVVLTRARKTKKILQVFPENKLVGEVLNYQNNSVKISCHFMPLRDYFIQEFMAGNLLTTRAYS
jgi:hypothetical protein